MLLPNCNFSRKNVDSAEYDGTTVAFNHLTGTTAHPLALASFTGPVPVSLEASPEDRVEPLEEGALLSDAWQCA
jgi:hypothetical protein